MRSTRWYPSKHSFRKPRDMSCHWRSRKLKILVGTHYLKIFLYLTDNVVRRSDCRETPMRLRQVRRSLSGWSQGSHKTYGYCKDEFLHICCIRRQPRQNMGVRILRFEDGVIYEGTSSGGIHEFRVDLVTILEEISELGGVMWAFLNNLTFTR